MRKSDARETSRKKGGNRNREPIISASKFGRAGDEWKSERDEGRATNRYKHLTDRGQRGTEGNEYRQDRRLTEHCDDGGERRGAISTSDMMTRMKREKSDSQFRIVHYVAATLPRVLVKLLMGVSWAAHETPMELPMGSPHQTPMERPWNAHGMPMELPMGDFQECSWYAYETLMKRPWG